MKIHHDRANSSRALTAQLVRECDSEAQLQRWADALDDEASELSCMCSAYNIAGEDTAGLARKLGYVKIAQNWVARRRKELRHGENSAEEAIRAKYRDEIKALRAQVEELRRANTALVGANAALKLRCGEILFALAPAADLGGRQ